MWHRWMSEDDTVSCLVCGGTWRTDEDGDAVASNGDAPTRCSGDTSSCHGAGDEHGHVDGECSRHDCNCAFCA